VEVTARHLGTGSNDDEDPQVLSTPTQTSTRSSELVCVHRHHTSRFRVSTEMPMV
jgi:hypothetical protein